MRDKNQSKFPSHYSSVISIHIAKETNLPVPSAAEEVPGSHQITPTGEMGRHQYQTSDGNNNATHGSPVHTCSTQTALIRMRQSACRGLSNTSTQQSAVNLASMVKFSHTCPSDAANAHFVVRLSFFPNLHFDFGMLYSSSCTIVITSPWLLWSPNSLPYH